MWEKIKKLLKNSIEIQSGKTVIHIYNDQKITVNGRKVDPKSPEGKKILKNASKSMDKAFDSMDEAFKMMDRTFKEMFK